MISHAMSTPGKHINGFAAAVPSIPNTFLYSSCRTFAASGRPIRFPLSSESALDLGAFSGSRLFRNPSYQNLLAAADPVVGSIRRGWSFLDPKDFHRTFAHLSIVNCFLLSYTHTHRSKIIEKGRDRVVWTPASFYPYLLLCIGSPPPTSSVLRSPDTFASSGLRSPFQETPRLTSTP